MAEDTQQPQRLSDRRIPVLDELRGIAVLLVMFCHTRLFGVGSPESGVTEILYARLANASSVGVDLFFVLSGYLITTILLQSRGDKHYYRVFYARRAARIFPLYYLALIIFFFIAPYVLQLTGHAEWLKDPLMQAPAELLWTYTLNWRHILPVIPCSLLIQNFWTLAVEEQFYLVWPAIIKHSDRRKLIWLCLAIIAASPLPRLFYSSSGMAEASWQLTYCRLDALAAGALVALCFTDAEYRARLEKFALPLVALSLWGLIAFTQNASWLWFSLTAVFFGSCLVLVLGNENASIVKPRVSMALRFFGKYSYAMYVFHQPLSILLAKAGFNAHVLTEMWGSRFCAIVAVNFVNLAVVTLLAWLSWHLLEKQFMKLR